MNLKDKDKRSFSYTRFYIPKDSVDIFLKVQCRHLRSKWDNNKGGFDIPIEVFESENYFESFTCTLKPNKIPNCLRCIYSTHHTDVECFLVEQIKLLLKEDLQ